MDLAIIIVGINGWERWTLPAIQSIKEHEPNARVVVVDAASETPYPIEEGVQVVRLDDSPSYSYAINRGIKAAGMADWYLILNNDIQFLEPIAEQIAKLDDSFLYGRHIIQGNGYRWLGLWLALISSKVWERVGEFDEGFKMCGFDDADYCIRAKHLGVDTLHVPLNIHHYEGKTRFGLPEYKKVREENALYFVSKHGFRPDNYAVIHD